MVGHQNQARHRGSGPQLEHRSLRLRPSRGSGFTLIEGLIATAILLVLAVGLLPLFTRSMVSNERGSDFNRITNAAKTRAEEFFQLPFDSPLLAINAGTERVFEEYFSQRDDIWKPGMEADAIADGDRAVYLRTTTVRQFNVNDLTTPLDSAAPLGTVQLREITVDARGTRTGGPLGPGVQNVVRVLKSQ